MNNFQRGTPAPVVSGSALTQITGSNCMILTLSSGSFTQSFSASQHLIAGTSNFVTGVYSASFAIPSNNSFLKQEIMSAGSGTFLETWSSIDRTVGYLTSSIIIKSSNTSAFLNSSRNLSISITNLNHAYPLSAVARLRFHVTDLNVTPIASRIPVINGGLIIEKSYYRIRDAMTNDIIIPFESTLGATQLSTDSDGMFFDIYMTDLEIGRVYDIDIMVILDGITSIFTSVGSRFRVDA